MSLVHNYGTWIGPCSLDRGFDGDLDFALARGSMASGAAENAGKRGASGQLRLHSSQEKGA